MQDVSINKNKSMTAIEFTDIWSKRNIENIEFDEYYDWKKYKEQFGKDEDYVQDGDTIISNVEITDVIELKDIFEESKFGNLFLDNVSASYLYICKSFTSNITIRNSSVMIIVIEDLSSIGHIKINNSTIVNNIIYRGASIGKNLTVSNKSKIDFFQVSDASNLTDISISESTIKNVVVERKSRIGNFTIDKSEIANFRVSGETNMDGLTDKIKPLIGKDVVIKNSKIGKVTFGFTSLGDLKFLNSSIDEFQLSLSTIADFEINNIIFSNASNITQTIINNLTLGDFEAATALNIESVSGKQIRAIIFKSFKSQKVFFQGIEIGSVYFNTVISKDSLVQFTDSFINQLEFNATQNLGSILFTRLKPLNTVRELKTEDFDKNTRRNKETGEYNILERPYLSAIYFISSDLGKASFIGCRLDLFSALIFYNSKITELFLAGSQFPTEIFTDRISYEVYLEHKMEEKEKKFDQKKQIYSQLKKMAITNGDSIKALEYKGMEYNSYHNLIIHQKKPWSERFILWFMKFTSYYGTNWWLAVKVTIGFSLCAFTIYSLLVGNRLGTDYQLFFRKLTIYLDFINPLHKNDDLIKLNVVTSPDSNWLVYAHFWDGLCRIIISILIYQILQAFRKHNQN